MGWRGRQGPAQQGSLNHAGCLHFILLQKTVGGFQQSHGLMGYSILKDHCCIQNALYVGGG